MKQKRKKPLITDWAYKEGVFLTPKGNYIARVRQGSNLKTISQHKTEEDAQKAYDDFYNAT